MVTQAWIFMSAVWGLIILCTLYSFWKLLRSDHQLGPDDQESPPPS